MNKELSCGKNEIELEKEILSEQQVSMVLFSLLEALSHHVLSEDIWWFVKERAKENAVGIYGVSEKKYEEIISKLEIARKDVASKNILKTLY